MSELGFLRLQDRAFGGIGMGLIPIIVRRPVCFSVSGSQKRITGVPRDDEDGPAGRWYFESDCAGVYHRSFGQLESAVAGIGGALFCCGFINPVRRAEARLPAEIIADTQPQ